MNYALDLVILGPILGYVNNLALFLPLVQILSDARMEYLPNCYLDLMLTPLAIANIKSYQWISGFILYFSMAKITRHLGTMQSRILASLIFILVSHYGLIPKPLKNFTSIFLSFMSSYAFPKEFGFKPRYFVIPLALIGVILEFHNPKMNIFTVAL